MDVTRSIACLLVATAVAVGVPALFGLHPTVPVAVALGAAAGLVAAYVCTRLDVRSYRALRERSDRRAAATIGHAAMLKAAEDQTAAAVNVAAQRTVRGEAA